MLNFLTLSAIVLMAHSDPHCGPARGALADTFTISSEILRHIHTSRLDRDPFAYCSRMMAERFLATRNHKIEELVGLSDSQVTELAAKAYFKTSPRSHNAEPWIAAMIPSSKTKELALSSSLFRPNSIRDQELASPPAVVQSRMIGVFSHNPCTFPDYSENLEGYEGAELDSIHQLENQKNDFIQTLAEYGGSAALCPELDSLKNIPSCTKNLTRMIEKMREKGTAKVIRPDLYSKVLGSGAYDEGLKIAANMLFDRYQSKSTQAADIFDDLNKSFIKSGRSRAEARTMTWNTLGLLATGGANMAVRLDKLRFKGDRWPAITALSAIAGLVPALDFKYGPSGKLYSLPHGILGGCDTSKTYHFWMAAFLAREARLDGASGQTAAVAAFSTAKGYANAGNLTSRAAGAILLHKPFSPASQVVRADLAYALMGANYGAGVSQQLSPINLDRTIATMTQIAPLNRPLRVEQLGGPLSYSNYSRWSSTFNPNELFRRTTKNLRYRAEIERDADPPSNRPKCP